MVQGLRLIAPSLLLVAITAVVVSFFPSFAGNTEAATGTPWVKSLSGVGPISITPTGPVQVATMSLPAAKYEISAKVKLVANPGPSTINCQLVMGTSSDSSGTLVSTQATLPLTLTGALSSPGQVVLSCTNPTIGTAIDAVNIKLIAMRVGTLKNA
jgi:hypothetical protein